MCSGTGNVISLGVAEGNWWAEVQTAKETKENSLFILCLSLSLLSLAHCSGNGGNLIPDFLLKS